MGEIGRQWLLAASLRWRLPSSFLFSFPPFTANYYFFRHLLCIYFVQDGETITPYYPMAFTYSIFS
jgi:hypothetical protein